jgi:hypothetical protein
MTAPRRRLSFANGVFLVVVGGVQVVFELLTYGLALIIGVLLLAVDVRDLRRFWHGADGHRGHRGALRFRGRAHRRLRGVS